MADDLMQLAALEGRLPYPHWRRGNCRRSPTGARARPHPQNAGAFPWFFDPHFRMAFFRPLSSTLIAADYALWGLQPIGYRVRASPGSCCSCSASG
jgi:hypothetical protein